MRIAPDIIMTILSIVILTQAFTSFMPAFLGLGVEILFNAYLLFRYQHLITGILFGSFSKKPGVRLTITLWGYLFLLGYFPIRTFVEPFDALTSFLYNIRSNMYLTGLTLVVGFPIGHVLWKNSDFKRWSGPIPAFFSKLQMGDFNWHKYKERIVSRKLYRLLYKTAAGLVFSFIPIIFGFYFIFLQVLSGIIYILTLGWLIYCLSKIIAEKTGKENLFLKLLSRGFNFEGASLVLLPRRFGMKALIGWFIIAFDFFVLSMFSVVITVIFAGFSMGMIDYTTFLLLLGVTSYFLLPTIVYQFLFLVRLGRRLRPFMNLWNLNKLAQRDTKDSRLKETLASRLPRGGIFGFCMAWVALYLSHIASALNYTVLDLASQVFSYVWPGFYIILLFLSVKKGAKKSKNENLMRDNIYIPITLILQFAMIDWVALASQLSLSERALWWYACLAILALFYLEDYLWLIKSRFKESSELLFSFAYFPAILSPLIFFGYWLFWVAVTLLCIGFAILAWKLK